MSDYKKVEIETQIALDIERVWKYYTSPEDIVKWNTASEDWHTTRAENNLYPGGRFLSRMEAKDGSFGFDFSGVYTEVKPYDIIEYTLDDGRSVALKFKNLGDKTDLHITFDAENENPIDLQKAGWQAILDHFKAYVMKETSGS